MASSGNSDREFTTYHILYSEAAEEELGQAYLWRSSIAGPEAADRWVRGLRAQVDRLAAFPYRCPALLHQPDVRRLLYGSYRLLYRVVEPVAEGDEALVRILHIYHGARRTEQAESSPAQTPETED